MLFSKKSSAVVRERIQHHLPVLASERVEERRHIKPAHAPEVLPTLRNTPKNTIGARSVHAPAQKDATLPANRRANASLKEKQPRISVHDVNSKTDRNLQADAAHYFKIKDGRILGNMADLRVALATLSSEIFNHHVNFERNDFANFTRTALHERELADRLDGCTSRAQMIRVLNDFFDEN